MAVAPTPDWWERINRIIRVLSVQEVKTPLSFTFKAAFYLVALWIIVALWAPGSEAFKQWIIKFSALVITGLCVGIWVFAFIRPTNLVYGETGHRAERKMELYGTERQTLTEPELESTPQTENRGQLPPPEEKK